jgi:Fe-S-cluster containining protein
MSDSTHTVPAGNFREWLAEARASLLSDVGSNVPCGDCVGCCVSSYYIPLRLQDRAARERIPASFIVQASGQPPDHAMMGYREDGTCPMLSAGKCTIYAHRPQTCRDYDCRIFAAAGMNAGGPDKHVINNRVNAWRFSYPTEEDRQAHDAVLSAAAFIREKKSCFPGGRAPTAPTGIAVLAIKTYTVFLDADWRSKSDTDIAMEIVKASGEFDAAT